MHSPHRTRKVSLILRLFAIFLIACGLWFVGGGVYLAILGGSWYYVFAGLANLAAGGWMYRGKIRSVWLYLVFFGMSLFWAVWETHLDFWAMVPRVAALLGVTCVILLFIPLFRDPQPSARVKQVSRWGGLALATSLVIWLVTMLQPHGLIYNPVPLTPGKTSEVTTEMGSNWLSYGRTGEGNRYAPFDQITPANVDKLEVIWTARHGDIQKLGHENQNTPTYVNGVLYHCSPTNILTAINGSNGKLLWQYNPQASSPFWNRCRSVAYYDPGAGDACGPRIVMATIDARMLAVRADNGQLCETFGDKGFVDLKQGMGEVKAGFYMATSGAMLAGDKIVLGGWIADNHGEGEPSGVVRAFNAATGELIWAWDLGNPAITTLPPPGETYTRGTPNVWAPMAFDLKLGALYLPLGNATPDYWGGKRRPFDDAYSSSIVALDLATGRELWKYQTVHHDLWDYDLPAQPTLMDLPNANGDLIPALAQITKRGQIFLLDRRTGQPIAEVKEHPVPAGKAEGERYSPTQPYSVGMPAIGAEPLAENKTWGMTPLDHLYCRILFKKYHYQGDFTPPSTQKGLQFPGNGGGFNWGSASFDQGRNLLIVNDLRMPVVTRLTSREEVDVMPSLAPHGVYSKMQETPYGMYVDNFISPLYVPCMQPPYGTMSAIDMVSRQLVWQRPVGTTKEVGPLGIRLGIPFNVGMPTLGGVVTTQGGVSFISGTQDYYLRAIETETGNELWKGAIPTGGQATPLIYRDQESGREVIVVNAAGAPHNPRDRGDYLVAFALPKAVTEQATPKQ